MSKPKMFEKPAGVKDYLPGAVAKLRAVESRVLECMNKWGYNEIITPTLEYYDTVGVSSSTSDNKLFKLLDRHGTTLLMRSDMTAPIARVVASSLKDLPLPFRLSYHANVFRAMEDEAGREAEFFQTGVELVGDDTADADAEVVALAIAALQAAGVEEFKFALGHVGYLDGLLRGALQNHVAAQEELKGHLLNRDYVGYRKLVSELDIPQTVREELEGVLTLRGGAEICEQAISMTTDPVARQSIEYLCQVWEVLKAYGVSKHVLIDLTMIGDFSYYTGMTFEGYAASHGFPVCSGGRYDNLLSHFGRPAPATGFALKTNRIMELLGANSIESPPRSLILYSEKGRAQALKIANEMRCDEGKIVETRRVGNMDSAKKEVHKKDGVHVVDGMYYNDVIVID